MSSDIWVPGGAQTSGGSNWGEAVKAPWTPLLAAGGFLLASVLLNIPGNGAHGNAELLFGAIGYVLTPLGTALTLVWAMRIDKLYSAKDLYDASSGKRLIKYCSIVAILGFIAGLLQILHIANFFAILFAPGTAS